MADMWRRPSRKARAASRWAAGAPLRTRCEPPKPAKIPAFRRKSSAPATLASRPRNRSRRKARSVAERSSRILAAIPTRPLGFRAAATPLASSVSASPSLSQAKAASLKSACRARRTSRAFRAAAVSSCSAARAMRWARWWRRWSEARFSKKLCAPRRRTPATPLRTRCVTSRTWHSKATRFSCRHAVSCRALTTAPTHHTCAARRAADALSDRRPTPRCVGRPEGPFRFLAASHSKAPARFFASTLWRASSETNRFFGSGRPASLKKYFMRRT
mmetsp:Transcript_34166/g.77206  ORF Transcript_34166/g.77206 Transcript_34166/m.77206 type:complete len:274 (-) Transcript_34166:998-1819(-)